MEDASDNERGFRPIQNILEEQCSDDPRSRNWAVVQFLVSR
jgi:hypothetical protein